MHLQDAFLQALEQVRHRFEMRIYGYVVMPEHVHLLLSEPAGGKLAAAMQILKTKVSVRARKENKRIEGESPFWQRRYFDHNVRNREGFVTQLRYIHRNPVKRGLCVAPEDWPWSSFRAWACGELDVIQVESERIANQRAVAMAIANPPFPQK
jgi:putative transposase